MKPLEFRLIVQSCSILASNTLLWSFVLHPLAQAKINFSFFCRELCDSSAVVAAAVAVDDDNDDATALSGLQHYVRALSESSSNTLATSQTFT